NSRAKPQFSDAELNDLRKIAAHVEKSLRLSVRLLNAEVANHGFGEALSRIGIGVFVLDSVGCVMFSNPAGQHVLGDALYLNHGRLRIKGVSKSAGFDEAIARTILIGSPDPSADPKPILVRSDDRRLAIYVLPVFQ